MLPHVLRAAGLGGIWLLGLNGCSVGLKGLQPPGQQGDSLTAEPDAGTTLDANVDDDASQPANPAPGNDAAPPHHPTDAAVPDAGHMEPLPPDACTNATGPCVVVPSGWSLVAFAPAQAAACPAGFDTAPSEDLFEGPSASAGCSCSSCTVTQQPTCAAGAIDVHYDTDFSGTCGTVATPSPLSNTPAGACLTDIYQGSYALYDAQYTAPAPSGGACSAPAIANPAAVTYTSKDRVCQLNDPQAASCAAGVCKPDVSGSYAACIASPGHLPCPATALSVAHYLGSDTSFTCADCACSFTGTCSGTLTLYTNTGCTAGAYAISTDVCVGISSRATFNAYKYTGGTPKISGCQADAPGAPQNVALAGEQTICCAE
jgi:hypothetical protein